LLLSVQLLTDRTKPRAEKKTTTSRRQWEGGKRKYYPKKREGECWEEKELKCGSVRIGEGNGDCNTNNWLLRS